MAGLQTSVEAISVEVNGVVTGQSMRCMCVWGGGLFRHEWGNNDEQKHSDFSEDGK